MVLVTETHNYGEYYNACQNNIKFITGIDLFGNEKYYF